jgi:conflict system STAND superfamily ATPase
MATINPFFHRGPVRDPAFFFGRAHEQAFAAELLRTGQSVAVSGARRLGKTSLLFHLAHPGIAAGLGLGPDTTRWVYIDGGSLDGLDEEWLYGLVDRTLGGEADAVPYGRFVEQLRALAGQGISLILALDEFELLAANRRLGPALFNRLRGLSAQLPIQFITSSRDPLVELTFAHPETLSSPFFNIFAPLHLSPFTEPDALALLNELSARGGRPFGPTTVAKLLKLAGSHPLFLQVTGYRAYAALPDGGGELTPESWSAVRAQSLADLEPHLSYYWSNLDAASQHALAALPLLAREGRSPLLAGLEAAALIRGGAYLSDALETFVRRQPVDGLLQGGSFLLDMLGGQALARGAPLHLTPTELAALRLFLEHPGQLLTPEAIEAALWPDEFAPDPERARGVVKKLRAALGPDGEAIVNRRGQGYLLALD